MTRTLERRTGKAQPIELRAGKSGSPGVLAGYAIVYDSLSQNLGGFVERVAPGAVDKSLADNLRVLARYNHDDNFLLGSTDSGTVRLASDSIGLAYEVDLPDTTAGRDVAALAKRGDLRHSSFAFYVPPGGDEWGFTMGDYPLRTLRAIQLVDVAPVNTPAYLDTVAAMRSLAAATGLDPASISTDNVEEIRSALRGDAPPESAQVDNHADPDAVPLSVRRLQLQLIELELEPFPQ